MSFSTRILVWLVAGVATGLFFGELVAPLGVLATGFVKLLQMTVLPYVTISIVTSLASGRIARSRARVVPPVPGPSSTTTRADSIEAVRTMRRSRKRELGMIEPREWLASNSRIRRTNVHTTLTSIPPHARLPKPRLLSEVSCGKASDSQPVDGRGRPLTSDWALRALRV